MAMPASVPPPSIIPTPVAVVQQTSTPPIALSSPVVIIPQATLTTASGGSTPSLPSATDAMSAQEKLLEAIKEGKKHVEQQSSLSSLSSEPSPSNPPLERKQTSRIDSLYSRIQKKFPGISQDKINALCVEMLSMFPGIPEDLHLEILSNLSPEELNAFTKRSPQISQSLCKNVIARLYSTDLIQEARDIDQEIASEHQNYKVGGAYNIYLICNLLAHNFSKSSIKNFLTITDEDLKELKSYKKQAQELYKNWPLLEIAVNEDLNDWKHRWHILHICYLLKYKFDERSIKTLLQCGPGIYMDDFFGIKHPVNIFQAEEIAAALKNINLRREVTRLCIQPGVAYSDAKLSTPIIDALAKCKNITDVTLRNCYDNDLLNISRMLAKNSTIVVLVLNAIPSISEHGTRNLADALRNNPTSKLRKITIICGNDGEQPSNDAIKTLADAVAFAENKKGTKIDISISGVILDRSLEEARHALMVEKTVQDSPVMQNFAKAVVAARLAGADIKVATNDYYGSVTFTITDHRFKVGLAAFHAGPVLESAFKKLLEDAEKERDLVTGNNCSISPPTVPNNLSTPSNGGSSSSSTK